MIDGTEVTIELKVRSMEHAIVQAFNLYEGKINEEIKDLVHAIISGFNFKQELAEELRREIRHELSEMCRQAVRGGWAGS